MYVKLAALFIAVLLLTGCTEVGVWFTDTTKEFSDGLQSIQEITK